TYTPENADTIRRGSRVSANAGMAGGSVRLPGLIVPVCAPSSSFGTHELHDAVDEHPAHDGRGYQRGQYIHHSSSQRSGVWGAHGYSHADQGRTPPDQCRREGPPLTIAPHGAAHAAG